MNQHGNGQFPINPVSILLYSSLFTHITPPLLPHGVLLLVDFVDFIIKLFDVTLIPRQAVAFVCVVSHHPFGILSGLVLLPAYDLFLDHAAYICRECTLTAQHMNATVGGFVSKCLGKRCHEVVLPLFECPRVGFHAVGCVPWDTFVDDG
jgi:hypothetical protein